MRTLIIIISIILTSCYSWSQEKVEKLPRISFADELVSSDWGFYGHYFASDKYKKELRANEKEKIIDRAEYTLSNGNKVYVKMRLFRNKKGFIDEEFLSDAYYVENNALFLKKTPNNRLDDGNPFHPTGKKMFKHHFDEITGIVSSTYYTENGAISYRKLSVSNHSNRIEQKNMTISTSNPFAIPTTDMYQVGDFTYNGFSYAGDLHKSTGEVISGFFLTLNKLFLGESSLVYVDNPGGKNYWALYVRNQLERVFYDLNIPKPNMSKILPAHQAEYFTVEKMKKPLYKDLFPNQKTPKEIYVSGLFYMDYKPIDSNYSGYGMKITTSNGEFIYSDKTVQIGIFKGGKLNGPGFEFKIKNKATYKSNQKEFVVSDDAEIDGKIGVFKNGVLEDGRKYHRNANYLNLRDYASKPEMEHIHYKGNYKVQKYKDQTGDDFKEWFSILKGRQIYLEQSNRLFTVTKTDKNTKTIYFQSDTPGVELSVGPNHKGLYAYRFYQSSKEVPCNPFIYRDEYKTVEVSYTNTIPNMIVDSRKVATASGHKVYTTYADVEVTTYLGTKQVKTGNKIKVPNPDCNPNGLKKISTSTPLLFEIDYSK